MTVRGVKHRRICNNPLCECSCEDDHLYCCDACIDAHENVLRDYREIQLRMTNYDHHIDPGLADALVAGRVFARHEGWEFNGLVWWDGQRFVEAVYRRHIRVDTKHASILTELMRAVNDEWGWA